MTLEQACSGDVSAGKVANVVAGAHPHVDQLTGCKCALSGAESGAPPLAANQCLPVDLVAEQRGALELGVIQRLLAAPDRSSTGNA